MSEKSEPQRLPILENGKEVSHLSVRFDSPEAGGAAGGLCLVYLHGFGSDQEGEKCQLFRERALAAGHGFCSFDFQGHGRSGGAMERLTLSRNLADLHAVWEYLKARGQERLVLIGSSMGGYTAIWYSALHPQAVAAGLHIAPAFGMVEGFLKWAGEAGARRWEQEGVTDFSNGFVSCRLGWGWIADLRERDDAQLLATYRTPTLLLQGKHDESVSWRAVLNFAARCQYEGIELHLFADGDHRLSERKERLWEIMEEFLVGRGIG